MSRDAATRGREARNAGEPRAVRVACALRKALHANAPRHIAGDYFDIGWNTFLQSAHDDFNLRGTPCRFAAFHDNVSVESQGDALTSLATKPMSIYADAFSSADPTSDLGVGDFDGDHVDDVFVGTGATWWFSSAGQSEWRLLNRMPEHASQLRFGDFDGDGRTDVLAAHGADLDVSWGGVAPWQTVNVFAWALSDLAVGDFDGDHVSDLFLATGQRWFYAPGARSWRVFASSSERTSDLRFGDFTGDGKTDVFGVVGGQWQIVPGGGASWQPLRTALTSSVAGLAVADFDGDGYADVLRTVPGSLFTPAQWQYAARGWGGFVALRTGDSANVTSLPIGRFDADAKADVMEWTGNRFGVSSAAKTAVTTVSLQAMR